MTGAGPGPGPDERRAEHPRETVSGDERAAGSNPRTGSDRIDGSLRPGQASHPVAPAVRPSSDLAFDDAGFPRDPLPITRPRAEHFPTTHLTELLTVLRETPGDASHARLAETVMRRYAEPLAAYARGSTLREIADPVDLVHGFFAAALADPAYFERYLASGMRLRRWLMNGLLLHARGVARDRARAARREGTTLESAPREALRASDDSRAETQFDRAWALALLSEACASVESALLAEGRDRAWTVFRRHAIDGRSYIDLEQELGLGRQQMADLVRGVTKRLRARMLELLEDEGGTAAEELREVLRLVG